MLNLPDVTIWSMIWTEEAKWTSKVQAVLRYCRTIINPANTILFTTKPAPLINDVWQTIQIPPLNWQSYNIFINRVVPTHIKSGFAMSVHEDGFPIDESLWSQEFLAYDYIGAPWDDGVVGNGGFNIESRKLMDLKSAMPVTAEDFHVPSDRLICTTRRAWLEEQGIRFCPMEIALRFSTEQVANDRASFGFHGRNASRDKYRKGWRMIGSGGILQKNGFYMVGNRIVPAPHRITPRQTPIPPRTIQRPINPVTQIQPILPKKIESVTDLKLATDKPPFEIIELPPVDKMSVTVVYVYAVVAGAKYNSYAQRFLDSYQKNTPLAEHNTVVAINGNNFKQDIQDRFMRVLPNCTIYRHDNSGYDLGAFQRVSKQCKTDLIVFFGASTYLNGSGWLRRMKEVVGKHGFALYGAMGNRGSDMYRVWPHIRTTAFWLPPSLFNSYPRRVTRPIDRHPFEHGPDSFTGFVRKYGLKALVVTKKAEYEWENWDDDPNGFHRGDQSNLLAGDHISEPPYYPPEK